MNKNKINRARMIAKCGKYPLTFEYNLARVPTSVVINCSAKILAEVVDAINDAYDHGMETAFSIGTKTKPGNPPSFNSTGKHHG